MDIREKLVSLALKLKEIHARTSPDHIDSVLLIGQLDAHNAAVNLGMTPASFARAIGLTSNQYWKRVQAARVIRFFPESLEMLRRGETTISHLAVISPKITQANASIILSAVKNKTKSEVEAFLPRVTMDGRILDKEPEFEIRLRLSESQTKLLERARRFQDCSGRTPSAEETIVKSLTEFIERRASLPQGSSLNTQPNGLRFQLPQGSSLDT